MVKFGGVKKMKCNWCGRGSGSNRTKKDGMTYYYVCHICVGDYKKEGYWSDELKVKDPKAILEQYWDLKVIAELFIKIYPEDVFVSEPKQVIALREGFKKLLNQMNNPKPQLKCHWCESSEAPFTKLNIETYGDNKFICRSCYKNLDKI